MSKILSFDASPTVHLMTPLSLKEMLPASEQQKAFVLQSREQIERILSGKDPRMLLIIGPCSIHDTIAAKEYATKLRALADKTESSFFIVMRTYFEKPRTSQGWNGMFYDPYLNGSHDINKGMHLCRTLLLDLASLGIPAATEFLDPAASSYYGDMISWSCIGARTAESQSHRLFASGLPMPVAFKNSTSGSIDVAVHGALVAATPQTYLGINDNGCIQQINTKGNPLPHIVLRGGKKHTNYDPQSISEALEKLEMVKQPRRLIIDCSHGNSMRDHEQQIEVFRSVIYQRLEGNNAIKGAAIESHLFSGNQPHGTDTSSLKYGVSLTDPCLDWVATEQLVAWGADMLQKQENATPFIKPERPSAITTCCAQL